MQYIGYKTCIYILLVDQRRQVEKNNAQDYIVYSG